MDKGNGNVLSENFIHEFSFHLPVALQKPKVVFSHWQNSGCSHKLRGFRTNSQGLFHQTQKCLTPMFSSHYCRAKTRFSKGSENLIISESGSTGKLSLELSCAVLVSCFGSQEFNFEGSCPISSLQILKKKKSPNSKTEEKHKHTQNLFAEHKHTQNLLAENISAEDKSSY